MLFPMFANNPNKSPSPGFGEKVAYGLGDFASCIIYAASQAFLLFYYTEYCDVNIAVVSTIFLISRFFDGASDLVMGYIVDRTRSPYGKTRVWILRMVIPFFLSSVLLFAMPESLGDVGKIIYIFVTYNLAITVVYTAINLPYGALTTLISKDSYERSIVTIFRVVLSSSGYMLTTVVTIPLVRFFGDDREAWIYTFIVLGGLAALLFCITFVSCQERVVADDQQKKEEAKLPFKEKIKDLFRNKYWCMLTLMLLLFFGADIIAGAANIYYYKYFLSDPQYIGIFSAINTVLRLSLMIAVLPYFMRRFGKRFSLMLAIIFIMVGYGVRYVDPYSVPINYLSTVLVGLGQGFSYALLWGMVPDTVDYGEYVTHHRAEGLVYSGASFATKVANGLGTVLVGFVINLGGYVNNAEQQTEEALNAILFAASGVPVIVFIIGFVILYFYRLDAEFPEVVRTLKERQAQRSVQKGGLNQEEKDIIDRLSNS
ncbi:MAG: glycoside-pentoside-hexuronide (GPH):cation symporter [Candidatus Anaerobiospirillum pullicola]|uniref:Glycoside-pentoside-hexuronide (GPH):cation symporter n=1 Tax=Candidatus Anaerobiospirillum pullicola TaxID=2838451 RepID=A0A948TH90_9GAMM|nr:glycoside-pentoside-hexuronide (GPH):cation symporter [Candidatus Anaerobiospirillum pullicola]